MDPHRLLKHLACKTNCNIDAGLVAFFLSAALACSIPAAHAATWDGGGADNLWTNPLNWGGTAPVALDPLVFAGTTQLTSNNTFTANTQFNGITFNAGAGAFVLQGNAINLGGNIVDNSTSPQQILTPFVLQQDTSISNTGNKTLTMASISGASALTKSGSGLVIFIGAGFSYTGGTTVSQGTLRSTPDSTANVFGTGDISIASGATLEFRAISTNTVVTGNVISGAGTVNIFGQTGTSVEVLSGANTYTGVTTVSTGTLLINGSLGNTGANVSVANLATLGGNGTISRSVSVAAGGILSPGGMSGGTSLAGTLDLAGGGATSGLTLADTSVLKFNLQQGNFTEGGGINDLITVGGALTLDGTLQITELGGSLTNGTYRLFTYTGALTDNTLIIDAAFSTTHAGSTIDKSVASQINLIVAPEPSTFVLLALSLTTVVVLRFRRRA